MSESLLEEVKRMAQGLSLSDRMILVDELSHSLGHESAEDEHRKPRSLRGSWRGSLPEDFDIDSAFHEIRHEREEEFLDIAPGTQKKECADRR
jgi:hypothetical protein